MFEGVTRNSFMSLALKFKIKVEFANMLKTTCRFVRLGSSCNIVCELDSKFFELD